jgi:hypothetical protein
MGGIYPRPHLRALELPPALYLSDNDAHQHNHPVSIWANYVNEQMNPAI